MPNTVLEIEGVPFVTNVTEQDFRKGTECINIIHNDRIQTRGRYILHSWLCLQVVGLVAYQVVSRNKILAVRLPRKCFHWLIEMVIDMIYTVWIITRNKSRREQCRNWISDSLCRSIYYHRIIYQRSWKKLKNINCKYSLYPRMFEVKKMKIACFNSVNHILQRKNSWKLP